MRAIISFRHAATAESVVHACPQRPPPFVVRPQLIGRTPMLPRVRGGAAALRSRLMLMLTVEDCPPHREIVGDTPQRPR